MNQFPINSKRVINAWAMFDWANSAYFLVISTAIFPIYYTAVTADTVTVFGTEVSNSSVYMYAVSFAYLIVAILAPLLSGIADYGGKRLAFLKGFTWIGGLACIALYFFADGDMIWFGIWMFVLSTIGAAGGIVYYNSFLPEIVTEDRYDAVSARGYAFGYVGSVILLAISLVMINKPELFGFPDAGIPTRLSFVMVGVWWIAFAHITFKYMPKDKVGRPKGMLSKGFDELVSVWHKVRKQKMVMRFLASFLFYMAGVQTVIYLASIFASIELEMEEVELIIVILLLQILAIVGAWLFALVSKKIGNRNSLLIQIAIWMLICVGAYFVTEKTEFYILASAVGMVLGGIQSLSRSTFAKLIEDKTQGDLTSHFSFYDVLMKISLVGGAFIFAFVEQITGGMRNSVLALMILFLVGMILMWSVNSKRLEGKEVGTEVS